MKFVYAVIAQNPNSVRKFGKVRYLIVEDDNNDYQVYYSKDNLKTTLQNINQYPLFDGLWTNNIKDWHCPDYYPEPGADVWVNDNHNLLLKKYRREMTNDKTMEI